MSEEKSVSTITEPLMTLPVAPLGIVALESSRLLGEKVNDYLLQWRKGTTINDNPFFTVPGFDRKTYLLDGACPRFGNGEGKGILRQSVRGYDLFIIVDVNNYSVKYKMYGEEVPMSPDDHFSDLKRIIAASAGKAKRVNVIMPLLYCSRQHRRSGRESLDCANALLELQNMGVQNLITFDAHDSRVQNAVPLMGFDNIMPTYQILKALFRVAPNLRIHSDDMMIVSPDEGGLHRNIYYATVLGIDMGMFYKRRDYTRVVNGRNPIVAHEYIGSSVEGKDVLIADDMISSGDSVIDIARELKKRKARSIYVAVTFGLFTEGIEHFNKAYEEGIINKIFATNLSYLPPEVINAEWFEEVDMTKYVSYVIATLNHDRSTSALLNPLDRINKLLKRVKAEQKKHGIVYDDDKENDEE